MSAPPPRPSRSGAVAPPKRPMINRGVSTPVIPARRGAISPPPPLQRDTPPSTSSLPSIAVQKPNQKPNETQPAESKSSRHQIALEILSTEQSYVLSLGVMVERYKKPLTKLAQAKEGVGSDDDEVASTNYSGFLTRANISAIFSNIREIWLLNLELLKNLDARLRNWDDKSSKIGDVFLQFGPFLKMYNVYSNNYEHGLSVYNKLFKEEEEFGALCDREKKRSTTGNVSLEHLLIMPVQRIPRYNLLLRDLIKHTDKSHPDFHDLGLALSMTEKVAEHINTSKGRAENMRKLVSQSSKGGGFRKLLASHRHLVQEGVFRVYDATHRSQVNGFVTKGGFDGTLEGSSGGGGAELSVREGEVLKLHIYLFNDILVYAEKSQVKKHKDLSKLNTTVPLSAVWVKDRGQLNSFDIIIPKKYFIVNTTDEKQKQVFLKALQQEIANNTQNHQSRAAYLAATQTALSSSAPSSSSSPFDDSSSDSDSDSDSDQPKDAIRFTKYLLSDSTHSFYMGYWKNGLFHRKGELSLLNGFFHYRGQFSHGERCGLGRQRFLTGEVYEGQFLNDTMHGLGMLTTPSGDKFTGSFKHGQLHGKGSIKYANGDVFDGQFQHGQPNGEGKLVKACGVIYQGEFQNGVFEGQGRLYHEKVQKCYEGNFHKGQRHGFGKLVFCTDPQSGEAVHYYEGNWKLNQYHGTGTFECQETGEYYQGEWALGKKEGNGTLRNAQGEYKGKFSGNCKTRGEMRFHNGTVYNGGWKDERFHGHGALTYNTGVKYEGHFENGKKNGKFQMTLPLGRFQIACKNDEIVYLSTQKGTKVYLDFHTQLQYIYVLSHYDAYP